MRNIIYKVFYYKTLKITVISKTFLKQLGNESYLYPCFVFKNIVSKPLTVDVFEYSLI